MDSGHLEISLQRMAAKNFMCFCSKVLEGPVAACPITINIKTLPHVWYNEEILDILVDQ